MKEINENEIQNRWIIFLHIQKTAGTTLERIIDRQYKRTAIKPIDKFKELSEAHKKRIKYVNGPVYFGVHEFLPGPFTYVTMLRDPVDRVISYYYWLLEYPGMYLYKDVTSKHMTLKDFASSGLTVAIENGQTQFLAGRKDRGTAADYGPCTKEIFEVAKKNLQDHFSVVGVQEKFDETLVFLRKAFGWRNTFYVKRNVTGRRPKKEDVPKETLNVIEKHNEFDIELYQYAKQTLEEQIRQEGTSFEAELGKFRSLNKLYCKLYGNHYMKVYEFLHPVTSKIRRYVKAIQAGTLSSWIISVIFSSAIDLDSFFDLCDFIQDLAF